MRPLPRTLLSSLTAVAAFLVAQGSVAAACLDYVCPTPPEPPPAPPEAGDVERSVMILMDRSGSMSLQVTNCPGHIGETMYKWKCAIYRAIDWIDGNDTNCPAGSPVRGTFKYWFWQFQRFYSGSTEVIQKDEDQYSYCGIRQRLLEYQGPTVDDAYTPLAEAFCEAVDALNNVVPRPIEIRLFTDGYENSTTPTHKCWGNHSTTPYVQPAAGAPANLTCQDPNPVCTPDSDQNWTVLTANNMTVPSWETNMLAMGLSAKLSLTSSPPAYYTATQPPVYKSTVPPVLVSSEFFDYVPSPVRLVGEGRDSLPGVSRAAAAASPYAEYGLFLQGLAAATGGRMMWYLGEDPGGSGASTPHAVPGDVNDDGCVDGTDLTALLSVFGQSVSPANMLTYQADVTYDAIVDVKDYDLVVKNWGTGCPSVPPPAALPMEVLFGFEDASKWSSWPDGTVIANKTTPKTGGTYALALGGKGLRAVFTSPFSTTILHDVTGKIAYDVYVPCQQSGHRRYGQTMLLVNCPSAGLFGFPVGIADLSRKPTDTFSTVEFGLPWPVKKALTTPHSDLSFTIVVNSSDEGYLLDSLRFVK